MDALYTGSLVNAPLGQQLKRMGKEYPAEWQLLLAMEAGEENLPTFQKWVQEYLDNGASTPLHVKINVWRAKMSQLEVANLVITKKEAKRSNVVG
jgi:hypothetical protein